MTQRITLIQAARIAGDAPGTFTAMLSTAEKNAGKKKGKTVGAKVGRERMVDLAETILLRASSELRSGNLNVHEAFSRALGLWDYIAQIATGVGPLGQSTHDCYAVDAWGRVGADPSRIGYVCQGEDALGECVKYLARQGWSSWRTVNVSKIVVESFWGFNIAANGLEKVTAKLSEQIEKMPEDDAAFYIAIIAEMKRRLSGERRVLEPPAGGDWKEWVPLPHVAAAAMGAPA